MSRSHHVAYPAYLTAVMLLGSVIVAWSCYEIAVGSVSPRWLVVALLALLTGFFTVKIPGIQSKVTVSETLIFTNMILFGPAAGALTAAMDGLMGSIRARTSSRRWEFAAFNVSVMAVSAFVAGRLFVRLLGGTMPASVPEALLPLGAMAVVYYACNTGLVAVVVGLDLRLNIWVVWRKNFLWMAAAYMTAALFAALLSLQIGAVTTPMILTIAVAVLAAYSSCRAFLQKAGEAMRREQAGKAYRGAVEALAAAIGAQLQSTQGHVQRVQVYARGLARAMGVRDGHVLEGVEAAALLHDIGKLTVPEHILEKPGVLTEEELEKVRRHAEVGAEILATIKFPMPVADYVRYHHESWDGSGYPEGLQGEEIPLGARILAVADCYEALICDQPYRKSYTPEEALEIVRSLAGIRYDPRVVEVFASILPVLHAEAEQAGAGDGEPESVRTIVESARLTRKLYEVWSS